MSLTDVMSGANLQAWAQVALVLFAGAFLVVLVRMAVRGDRDGFERARRLPLDDEQTEERA